MNGQSKESVKATEHQTKDTEETKSGMESGESTTVGGETSAKDDTPMVSVDELKRRLAKQKETLEKQFNEERQQEHMTVEERTNKTIEDLQAQVADYKEKERISALKAYAREQLSRKGIDPTDDIVELVLKEDEEATVGNVGVLSMLLNQFKRKLANNQTPPLTSTESSDTDTNDIYKILDDSKKTGF